MTDTPVPTKRYVAGFAFNAAKDKVVLIRKNRPEWQAGKLNGVGGKIEDGDVDGYAAMCREFREETGVETMPDDWAYYLTLKSDFGYVQFFYAFDDRFMEAKTQSDEQVEIISVDFDLIKQQSISNLMWLIAIALDENQPKFFVTADYSPDFAKLRGI